MQLATVSIWDWSMCSDMVLDYCFPPIWRVPRKNVYNTSYSQMAKTLAVCKNKMKGTRKKAAAEGVLKEDCGLCRRRLC
jgi:hypothetical protein